MPPKKKKTTIPLADPAASRPNREFILLQEEKDFARWLSKDIAVLDYFAGNTERVPRELWITLETLRAKKGRELYVELLYALTHQYFPPDDAQKLWGMIVQHKHELNQKLGRDVGMKVAGLDFFDNHSEQGKDLQLLPDKDLDNLLIFANEDGLTGLYNHRYFQEHIRYEIDRCKRYNHECTLLFVDLDHFKHYNDRYGHLKGDILIREIGTFFKKACRLADVVARYGGDEFAFILPETNQKQARSVAERLQETFAGKQFGNPIPGVASSVTLSIGMSAYPANGLTAEVLIAAADQALYQAKHSGRNRICLAPQKSSRRSRPRKSR